VKDTNSPNGDPLSDLVKVDFHVLGTLMLNRVGGEVNSANIVTIDKTGRGEWLVQFLQKLLQPICFGDAVGNDTVLNLGTGPGDHGLPF
jgi:hypothetical protein